MKINWRRAIPVACAVVVIVVFGWLMLPRSADFAGLPVHVLKAR